MGDFCNMNDIHRFLRSKEGKAELKKIRDMLKGRMITDVTFSNEVTYIATTLLLDDGESFFVQQPSLEVDAIREEFAEVLQREYNRDYPKRKRGKP